MTRSNLSPALLALFTFRFALAAVAADAPKTVSPGSDSGMERASASIRKRLDDGVAELAAVRERAAAEVLPLSRELGDLEAELASVRNQFQEITREIDACTLEATNLRGEIKTRKDEAAYLENLLAEYVRQFETRLHICEIQRYRAPLQRAKQAQDDDDLAERDVYSAQTELLKISLERLHEAMGGARFPGTAIDSTGIVQSGDFALLGPAALFRSADGSVVGSAELKLGSLEPVILPFSDPLDAAAAAEFVEVGAGSFPLDPTLGNARKVEVTQESPWEHILKGGPVMYPIMALAGAAFLVAVFKWLSMVFVRSPSRKRLHELLAGMRRRARTSRTNRRGRSAVPNVGPRG